jgi:hypothetical protein
VRAQDLLAELPRPFPLRLASSFDAHTEPALVAKRLALLVQLSLESLLRSASALVHLTPPLLL